ncbi:S8 family peptidase [Sphingobium sp. SCG-1]|uniref:S8 family peptidase n=1 Tax=Sphingobium sp. SCG-1 TaxID=2072936 RepID=UPI00166FA69B|nr:S8 family peptidase [Sphingobium sp. SCG-1]
MSDALRPQDDRLDAAEGSYIEVDLRSGTNADALDLKGAGIRSGSAKVDNENDRTITLFVPDSARLVLEQIIEDYLTGPLTERAQNPPNQAKVEAIEAFRTVTLASFWTDDRSAMPETPQEKIWWALWCHPDGEDKIEEVCERMGLRVADRERRQYFPEIVVIPVWSTRAAIELLLYSTGAVSELRRANDSPKFFLDDIHGEQAPWVEDFAERITWPASDAPAVCIFDTGVNRAHSLIEPALSSDDMHAIDRAWGTADQPEGHGTAMAGLALHGDLTASLGDRSTPRLKHRLESVKIMPPRGFDPHEPHNYGPVTQSAISLPEISAPDRGRIFCMAVTNDKVSGARPSAWSAAIDQAAIGAMPGDDDHAPKRLIVLSGGNTPSPIEFARLRPQDEHPIEDPAQAWNALSVGGYTDFSIVGEDGYEDWTPLADTGALSPHSCTSASWPRNAPIKPEIVMEAGNRGVSPARRDVMTFGSMSLCSTGADVATDPLVAFQGTSAAAAQAARLAARLLADHPEFWPETVRGLMVHSAEWTEHMIAALARLPGKKERCELIRHFGYGVPDYERATASAQNHLALFSQAEIQPFRLQGGRKFNECHYYDLPIPRDILEEMENKTIELKVTLSYFIDPNPGRSANINPFRYQSHGLRFDLRRKAETLAKFKERVNASERDDPLIAPPTVADDNRWTLGPQNINSGSLHSDIWIGPAIELLGRDTLCIKPVGGWCRDRSTREHCNAKRRYSLIVTVKAHDATVDLYTPIKNMVDVTVDIAN